MNEYKKEDIINIHFNHHNEIQFEYGGQIHHHSMDSLKETFIGCWNLQQENKQLKEDLEREIQVVNELTDFHHYRWNELKKWLEKIKSECFAIYSNPITKDATREFYYMDVIDKTLNKIKELEGEIKK